METAGDVLQSFAQYVSIPTIFSIAHYPGYFEEVEKIIVEVGSLSVLSIHGQNAQFWELSFWA